MTPYFDDGTVTLYLGDCREITTWLAADVLVTDPPYGRAWRQGNHKGLKGDAYDGIVGDLDTGVRDRALTMWGTRQGVVFGDLTLAPAPGTKQTLVYAKPPDAGFRGAIGGFRRDAEAVYLTGPWPAGTGGKSSVLHTGARIQGSQSGLAARYGHPHAKPVDLVEQLISACPPGTVADPFAGSGSILIAARNLGRSAIGVEKDERYAEAAARRLSQPVLDFGASA